MEIYDTDDEQIAALKRWWNANGKSAVSGIIMGILVVVGWNFWKSYQAGLAQESSALFEQLMKAAADNNRESAQKISERLRENYGTTAYAEYAAFIQAKEKVDAGEPEEAKKILRELIGTAGEEMRHVARMRLIRLLLATGEYEQGLQLIAEADFGGSKSFEAGYEELKGDLYLAMERLGEARTAYQNALRLGQTTPLLQYKLDDVTAPEIIENIE
ncbi:MAG: YfgM family protein [Gammaproteobacteria bacterium]